MASGTTITQFTTTALDETLSIYGDVQALFQFLELNPTYDNVLSTIPVNTTIITDDFTPPEVITSGVTVSAATYIDVTAIQNQSLFDLSVRYYGDISKALQLLIDNPNLDNINQAIVGKLITINEPLNLNQNVVFYNKANSKLITGTFTHRAFNVSFSFAFH